MGRNFRGGGEAIAAASARAAAVGGYGGGEGRSGYAGGSGTVGGYAGGVRGGCGAGGLGACTGVHVPLVVPYRQMTMVAESSVTLDTESCREEQREEGVISVSVVRPEV